MPAHWPATRPRHDGSSNRRPSLDWELSSRRRARACDNRPREAGLPSSVRPRRRGRGAGAAGVVGAGVVGAAGAGIGAVGSTVVVAAGAGVVGADVVAVGALGAGGGTGTGTWPYNVVGMKPFSANNKTVENKPAKSER